MSYNPEVMINNLSFSFQKFISLSFCLSNVIFINPNIFKIAKTANVVYHSAGHITSPVTFPHIATQRFQRAIT